MGNKNKHKSDEPATLESSAEMESPVEATVAPVESTEAPAQPSLEEIGFEVDNGVSRAGKVDTSKFESLCAAAKNKIASLRASGVKADGDKEVTGVVLSLPLVNRALGTTVKNAHSTVYRIKDSKNYKPILDKYNIQIGAVGKWNADVGKQGIRFTDKDMIQGSQPVQSTTGQ